MMKTAIFPGTFDPPTLGHLNIISRSAQIFPHLYVAIGQNISKPITAFNEQERAELLKQISYQIPNIEIVIFHGLLADYMKKMSITTIVRSIRNFSDFEYEIVLAEMNRKIGGVETLYMIPDEKFRLISSTHIRELARYGKRLDQFVPKAIEPIIFERLSQFLDNSNCKF